MKPDVSIIVPVFNKEGYLSACLESITRQSFTAIEIICINDGSNDASRAILAAAARQDSRIRIFDNGSNLGAARSRNRGIKAAAGRYVRFVDADDLLPASSTEILHQRAFDTSSDVVRGSLAMFGLSEHTHLQTVIAVGDRATTAFRDEPSLWVPYWHTSYLISTQLLWEKNIVYPVLRRGEDPVFMASVLVNAKRISLMSDVVYLYRKYKKTSGSAATSFQDVQDTLAHAARVKELYLAYHPPCWNDGYGPFLLSDLQKFLARCALDSQQKSFVSNEAKMLWGDCRSLFPDRAEP